MNVLGYIVSDKKIRNLDSVVKQVNSLELADKGKPTLLVGWENAKKHSGYTSILNKKLDENLYWTFSKTESRYDFEKDIYNFYNIIYNNILNNIKYIYINIFKIKYNKLKKILYYILYSDKDKNIYINNNMIYIPFEDSVIGVSLNVLEYCGIKSSKVIEKIKSNPRNRIYYDDDRVVFKFLGRLRNNKYIIPYLIE